MKSWIAAACVLLLPVIAFSDDAKNVLKATNKTDSWRFEEHEAGKGSIKADDDAIVFKVDATTGTDWHVQAYQIDLDLKNNREYTVKFKAKAAEKRSVVLAAMIDQED